VIIVKVVLPLPIRKCFKYIMPDLMFPVIGGRIVVPFRSKNIIGIVISICKNIETNQLNLKYVKKLIDNHSLYTSFLLDILIWISRNYHCPIGNLFFSVLPKILYNDYILKDKIFYKWIITKKGEEIDIVDLKRRKKQLYTLLFLKKNSVLNSELKKYNLSKLVLKKLERQGLCKVNVVYESSLNKKTFFQSKKKFF